MEFPDDINNLIMQQLAISNTINQLKSKKVGEKPIVDGVIDPVKYINSEFKILWILREARDVWKKKENGEMSIGGWDLVNGLYKKASYDKICNNTTTRRELLINYSILNNIKYSKEDIKKYSTISSKEEKDKAVISFQTTAVINVKKFPGKKTSIKKEIDKAYKNTKDILIMQIETYNPNIVICGNTLSLFENELDYKKGACFPLGMGKKKYYCLPGRIYINAYHPSYKYRKNSTYEHHYISKIIEAVDNWKINFYKKS